MDLKMCFTMILIRCILASIKMDVLYILVQALWMNLGRPQAIGGNIDIPLPPGTGDEGLMKVMQASLVLPILEEFDPDIVINSAGQDNHFSDPLANMQVTARAMLS